MFCVYEMSLNPFFFLFWKIHWQSFSNTNRLSTGRCTFQTRTKTGKDDYGRVGKFACFLISLLLLRWKAKAFHLVFSPSLLVYFTSVQDQSDTMQWVRNERTWKFIHSSAAFSHLIYNLNTFAVVYPFFVFPTSEGVHSHWNLDCWHVHVHSILNADLLRIGGYFVWGVGWDWIGRMTLSTWIFNFNGFWLFVSICGWMIHQDEEDFVDCLMRILEKDILIGFKLVSSLPLFPYESKTIPSKFLCVTFN